MEYPNAAWLQQHQIPDLQSVPPDGQHVVSDDWKNSSSSAQTASGAAAVAPAIDLNEFGLGDLSGPSTSSSSVSNSSNAFYPFAQHSSYYLPSAPGPYNAVPYGTQWSSPAQLPLSSYSSLNGATSVTPSSTQQGMGPTSSNMIIDPALTTVNGLGSPHLQYQHSSSFLPSQPQSRPQYQQYQHQPTLSINPSYTPQQQQQQPPPQQHQHSQQLQQATLSPHVLFTPSSSSTLTGALPPSSFYQSNVPVPSKPPGPTPEQRRISFLTSIRPLLSSTSFTGAGAVVQLVDHIDDYGPLDVEPQTRLEILTKMRDNAPNHYFRAWVENEDAMDITREWLKSAYAGKSDGQMVETIMPLLHVIDRLPLTLDSLKSSKLGKIIVRLVKEPPAPAIKDMASNLERKWRQLLVTSHEESKRMDVDSDDSKGKKRKADAPSSKSAPPTKKAAVSTSGTSAKAVAVKKEVKTVVKEVKDAKSDSSFFSAPRPKPKLPSFKKAPPAPVKKEPDLNIAQPSSINPFEEALKLMARARKDSPATATPPPAPVTSTPSISATASGKRKKTVTWAPEGKLEMVKLIERAVYEDDHTDGMLPTHNVRDLDRDEGAALHAHMFEEQIEWFEPILIEIPSDIELRPRGEESQEKAAQEEREQSALVAIYVSPAQIPDSPAEPPTQISEEQVDEGVRVMLTGPDVDAIFWSGGDPAVLESQKHSVAELVGQLAAGATDLPMANGQQLDPKAFGLDTNVMQALPGFANFNAEQVQQLMQALAQTQGGMFQSQAPGQPSQSGDWNSDQYPDYDDREYLDHEEGGRDRRWPEDGWSERGGGRGRHRGRGRGRGDGFRNNKRKPCSFFAAGRRAPICRYGDQCDFSHEPIY
ncbi:uncharacterized protein LAESUDRAFT_640450 [Laetiporus sulphureus 93-53]|uniref:Serine/threonine-protein phosphatase 1 regulatory subunit 10 n=1 Tax=Laetiporus sulphureus 93-53 TaxID=1314785 RepID=A0A165I763_9APHY|nr:uncharacterized protein LAESUDRAFT_640450 [Laetiporus sulphureus 93-53]KZT12682.1 hypothetical protein LAESUDRAFT_640450 [Laetiporus sulphureus 93-53]